MSTITLSGGESAVTISGLSSAENINESAFDGITVTLTGAEVNNVSDISLSGSARRIIWNGKVKNVEQDSVLIIDTLTGEIKGSWLIEEPANLTYFDSSKAKVSLQFVDKKTALTPRTFTFMEKYNLLSLGSNFDHVTITAHDNIYLSRSSGKIINGVIKGNSKAQIDNGQWTFDDDESFVVETADEVVKFYDGSDI